MLPQVHIYLYIEMIVTGKSLLHDLFYEALFLRCHMDVKDQDWTFDRNWIRLHCSTTLFETTVWFNFDL